MHKKLLSFHDMPAIVSEYLRFEHTLPGTSRRQTTSPKPYFSHQAYDCHYPNIRPLEFIVCSFFTIGEYDFKHNQLIRG